MELSGRVESVRRDHGLSQREMASKLGVSLSTYQYYERGERVPPADFILNMVTTFGVNGDWLLTGEGRKERGAGTRAEGSAYHPEVMRAVIEAVEELVRLEGLELKPAKKAQLITILYEDSLEEGVELEVEEMKARTHRLLRLAT